MARHVISKSGLLLPAPMVEDRPTMVCRVPTGGGQVCREVVYMDDMPAHVRLCTTRHRDEIHNESPRTKMPFTDPNAWDVEIEQHMKKVGARMKKEGRLVVKPNERAGFS